MSGPAQPGQPQRAPPPRPRGIVSPAARFRREIETQLAEGAEPRDLTLRLTLSDANRLSRDPEVPVADISFAAGQMTFLGVRVQRGGVNASSLDLTADLPPDPEPAPAKPAKKPRATKAKAKAAD